METYRVGRYDAVPCDPDSTDPRGILWMWEQPQPRAEYVVAVDPTVGLTGWRRELRTRDDVDTDNAVIQVVRIGSPDVQVAEWAAPVDAIELAETVNFLGKTYCGNAEDGEALVAIEVWPGPGLATQNELRQRFGYSNLPLWEYLDKAVPTTTKQMGWYSSQASRRMLWIRGMQHFHKRGIIVKSPWLVEEMSDCIQDYFLLPTARARYGYHDDRVVSMLIAIWYANRWTMNIEPSERNIAEQLEQPNWQASDISVENMISSWEDRFSSLLEE